MKPYREIEFTTTRIKGDLTAGKTCYQGHLQHNAVLSEKETRKRFAECCSQQPFETNKYIDALGTFIAREIAHGNRLNFGAFGVGLHMSGGFKGANDPFDEKRNAISVCLIPGKEIKAAVKSLKPINVTEDRRWFLGGTLQRVPYEVWDEIAAEGRREITVTGCTPPVNPEQPDEGIWIENDAGEKMLIAIIAKSDPGHTNCTLEGSLASGNYWTVIQGRYLDNPDLIRCRHRIRVV